MLHRTFLTGVRADTPIGAMVSFGLLRLNPSFWLAWHDRIAVVFTPEPFSADELLKAVDKAMDGSRTQGKHDSNSKVAQIKPATFRGGLVRPPPDAT